MCVLIESIVTPPAPRLRLLLVGGVSFAFSFQFFTRLAAVFAEEVGDLNLIIISLRSNFTQIIHHGLVF
jgi:hypothetical protein